MRYKCHPIPTVFAPLLPLTSPQLPFSFPPRFLKVFVFLPLSSAQSVFIQQVCVLLPSSISTLFIRKEDANQKDLLLITFDSFLPHFFSSSIPLYGNLLPFFCSFYSISSCAFYPFSLIPILNFYVCYRFSRLHNTSLKFLCVQGFQALSLLLLDHNGNLSCSFFVVFILVQMLSSYYD